MTIPDEIIAWTYRSVPQQPGATMTSDDYLKCECVGQYGNCQCATNGPGPAVRRTTRQDGKRLLVCSRCTLPSDTDEEVLPLDKEALRRLLDYDALGFFAYGSEGAEKAAEKIKDGAP